MYHLSDKQRVFVKHYLGTFNATAAAKKAGYSWPDKAGPRVSHSPKIKPLIALWFWRRYESYYRLHRPENRPPDLSRTAECDQCLIRTEIE